MASGEIRRPFVGNKKNSRKYETGAQDGKPRKSIKNFCETYDAGESTSSSETSGQR